MRGGTSILLLFPTYLLVQNRFQFLFEIDDFSIREGGRPPLYKGQGGEGGLLTRMQSIFYLN